MSEISRAKDPMDENALLRVKIDALRDEVHAIASEMRHHASVEREALRLRRILAARGICEQCGADLRPGAGCACGQDAAFGERSP